LVFALVHPRSPDTSIIKSKAGLPLPTELTGEPAVNYLVDAKEQEKRRENMQKICLTCHSRGWVKGQYARFENLIETTNPDDPDRHQDSSHCLGRPRVWHRRIAFSIWCRRWHYNTSVERGDGVSRHSRQVN
jgi:hypothetical protein